MMIKLSKPPILFIYVLHPYILSLMVSFNGLYFFWAHLEPTKVFLVEAMVRIKETTFDHGHLGVDKLNYFG